MKSVALLALMASHGLQEARPPRGAGLPQATLGSCLAFRDLSATCEEMGLGFRV